jgi:hypothetical protein
MMTSILFWFEKHVKKNLLYKIFCRVRQVLLIGSSHLSFLPATGFWNIYGEWDPSLLPTFKDVGENQSLLAGLQQKGNKHPPSRRVGP